MMRRSSRGSTFQASGGSSSMSSSSSANYSASSSSTVCGGGSTQVVETSRVVGGGATIVGGGTSTVVETSRVVGGGAAIVGGGSTTVIESSRTVGGGATIVGGGSSRTVIESSRVVGGSTMQTSSSELTYETDVAQARLRLKPITSARASVMFGMSGGSNMAMVPYGGGRAAGGSRALSVRGGGSTEARQLAMHLETVIDERQRTKSDLWQLNERLAEYVEKTRFLEAQNKRLVAEADILKQGFSTESVTLKARYQVEIEETRRLIEESEFRFVELTNKVAVAEQHLNAFTVELNSVETTIETNLTVKDRLILSMGEIEGELATLRRRVGDFDLERNRFKGTVQRLRQEEADLRRDLDQERMIAMVSKNTAAQLKEELAFVLETQATKTTEMAGLAYRDTTEENRALWKSEFTELFRSMHSDYMARMEEVHSETEAQFQVRAREQQTTTTKDTVEMKHLTTETQRSKQQVDYLTMRSTELTARIAQYTSQLTEMTEEKARITTEFQETITRLHSEVEIYHTELTKTRTEVQTILDNKLSLEIEINNYRQLLDSEEVRIKEDIHAVIEDQRQVKELMASRGIYEGAMMQGGSSSFGMSGGVGGFGIGGGSSMSYQGGSYGGGFGGGFGGGYSSSSSNYYSSGGMTSGGFSSSMRF